MNAKKKIPTLTEMLRRLQDGEIKLPPVSIQGGIIKADAVGEVERLGDERAFVLADVSWGESGAKFFVECRTLWTPKAFREGVSVLKTSSMRDDYRPLLLMPYLRESQLAELEREGISGVDLCGNGLIMIPGSLAVFRTGQPNRFTTSAPIKNVYRKRSSLVGRCLLVRPTYPSVQEVCEEIRRRQLELALIRRKRLSLATVSKALKTMEQDLIITREAGIRLLQPGELLDRLAQNYTLPRALSHFRVKVDDDLSTIGQVLLTRAQENKLPIVATGMSSVKRYAVMERGEILSVYTTRPDLLLEDSLGRQTDRFPNLEVVVPDDDLVYFDARWEHGFPWASPIQVYLELMRGDKRDQETADQVRSLILQGV